MCMHAHLGKCVCIFVFMHKLLHSIQCTIHRVILSGVIENLLQTLYKKNIFLFSKFPQMLDVLLCQTLAEEHSDYDGSNEGNIVKQSFYHKIEMKGKHIQNSNEMKLTAI